MSHSNWLGVVSRSHLSQTEGAESWWCLPHTAAPGDRILFYCPRSLSAEKQGIFSEAEVLSSPSPTRAENCNCATYGTTRLHYVEIRIIECFARSLTAAQMKQNVALSRSEPVRKNFQGTAFKLETRIFEQMKSALTALKLTSSKV
ncbi:EVE domain-containing protein [Massilia oculi]